MELLESHECSVKLPTLAEKYQKTDLEKLPSSQLLLVIYTLLKSGAFLPNECELLNRIAEILCKRKPQFPLTEPNLPRTSLIIPNDYSEPKLFQMIKAGGDKNVETWLDFISTWKT